MIKIAKIISLAFAILFTFISLASSYEAVVQKIVDGDTILLANGEKVRYIGIDTPEYGRPFYEKAKEANRKLVQGKTVRLEFDVEKRNYYKRLLAYVYVGSVFVNAELVKLGYANIYTYSPNVKYADLFLKLQREAREKNRGLWAVQKGKEESYYVASKRSTKFHRPGCMWAEKISPKNRVVFKSRDEALNKGLSPCRVCYP